MQFLLDTCTISDFVKRDLGTLTEIKNHPPHELAISVLTLMEIEYGLILNPAKAKKLRPIFVDFFNLISIIPFNQEESDCAARIRAALKQAGTPIGSYDLLIGATAVCHNLTLVTANTREFSRIEGLTVENWRGVRSLRSRSH